mmetsp:Transcript_32527/g.52700  ORF Transcript_32527/g.52700 Transcript_32527/m.52700 type:complete len:104 (+) Transcript_32527:98-409(+)
MNDGASAGRPKVEIMNEILLKALADEEELDALRREKRLLAEEEKRLRALLDVEKSQVERSANRQEAILQRRQKKEETLEMHQRRLEEQEAQREERRRLLLLKP